jgi:hypothetical protein
MSTLAIVLVVLLSAAVLFFVIVACMFFWLFAEAMLAIFNLLLERYS